MQIQICSKVALSRFDFLFPLLTIFLTQKKSCQISRFSQKRRGGCLTIRKFGNTPIELLIYRFVLDLGQKYIHHYIIYVDLLYWSFYDNNCKLNNLFLSRIKYFEIINMTYILI